MEEPTLIDASSEMNQQWHFLRVDVFSASHTHKTHMDSVLKIFTLYPQILHSSLLLVKLRSGYFYSSSSAALYAFLLGLDNRERE